MAVEPVSWDYQITHERRILAPPEAVWQAFVEMRPADLPVARVLFWIRGLPSALRGKRFKPSETLTLFEGVTQSKFSILTFDEPELVEIGRIAKFWQSTPTSGPVLSDRAEFDAFAEPDFAKAIMSLEFIPSDGATLVRTTTGIKATDAGARKKFGRYWAAIRMGSALVRTAMLSAADRRATSRTGRLP